MPSSSPRATEDFTKKGREGDCIGEGLHQGWRTGDLDFTSLSRLFSQGTLIPDLVRSTWLKHGFEISSVNMLHWWYRSNAQSLELIRDGLNRGTLVRVAERPYRTCPVCYRTCPVWLSRADPLLPFWFNPSIELFVRLRFFCIFVLQTYWQLYVKMVVKPWIKDSTSKLQFEIIFGHVSKILWKSFGYRQQLWVEDRSPDPSTGMI